MARKPAKTTTLCLNSREGIFYLRTVYAHGSGIPDPRRPGWVIKEHSRVAGPGLAYAIQVKHPEGWRSVDDGTDRNALRKIFDRDWRRRKFKTRFVATHPESDEPLEIHHAERF